MSVGLRTWDDQGKSLIDLTKPLSKIFGNFTTGLVNGSIIVPDYNPVGSDFFIQTPLSSGGRFGKLAAVVYEGAGRFTWAFSYQPQYGDFAVDSRIFYGTHL